MKRQYYIETRQKEYRPFFDDDFAKLAFSAAQESPALEVPIFDLIADWRSASYAGALPAHIPAAIKSFHDAYVDSNVTSSGILKYSEAILRRLSLDIPELSSDQRLQGLLLERLVSISSEITEVSGAVKSELNGEAVWQQYLNLQPFSFGLHGTMRLVYLAVYGAYENFLVRALSIAHGGKRMRISDPSFKQDFRDALGHLIEDVWFREAILVARLTRHALVHAGGRLTADLRKHKIPLEVHEEQLHVYPEHISLLYNELKDASIAIMRAERFRSMRNECIDG